MVRSLIRPSRKSVQLLTGTAASGIDYTMQRHLLVFSITILLGATVGAAAGYLLADGLPEGAIAGAIVGGSLGMIIGLRLKSSGAEPAFEFEAAGIPDDNLITIARNNLGRDAYRSSFGIRELDDSSAVRDQYESLS